MTTKDINVFYRRMRREMEGRTRRKLLEAEIRDLERIYPFHTDMSVGDGLRLSELRRELKELEF